MAVKKKATKKKAKKTTKVKVVEKGKRFWLGKSLDEYSEIGIYSSQPTIEPGEKFFDISSVADYCDQLSYLTGIEVNQGEVLEVRLTVLKRTVLKPVTEEYRDDE